jgi:hypothetical protein
MWPLPDASLARSLLFSFENSFAWILAFLHEVACSPAGKLARDFAPVANENLRKLFSSFDHAAD